MSHRKPIRAAGAVVLRTRTDGTREVLVVHRPRYRDITLPKGKQHRNEPLPLTAVREVAEETGCRIRLGVPLQPVEYSIRKVGPKVVSWWIGEALEVAHERPRVGEQVVRGSGDIDVRGVGDHVAGHPAADRDRRQTLAVLAAVDVDPTGLVARQRGQDTAELVNGVVAHPRPGRVRSGSRRRQPDPQRPLASGFDEPRGRLAEDRDVEAGVTHHWAPSGASTPISGRS